MIFDLYSKIIKALDNDNYACSVFLDFTKASDTLNYEILIEKLDNYGVGECWINDLFQI